MIVPIISKYFLVSPDRVGFRNTFQFFLIDKVYHKFDKFHHEQNKVSHKLDKVCHKLNNVCHRFIIIFLVSAKTDAAAEPLYIDI